MHEYVAKCIVVISGCHLEVDKNCTLLCCYAASRGNSLLTFQDNQQYHLQGSWILTLEGGTDRLSRNVGKELTTTHCIIAHNRAVLICYRKWCTYTRGLRI